MNTADILNQTNGAISDLRGFASLHEGILSSVKSVIKDTESTVGMLVTAKEIYEVEDTIAGIDPDDSPGVTSEYIDLAEGNSNMALPLPDIDEETKDTYYGSLLPMARDKIGSFVMTGTGAPDESILPWTPLRPPISRQNNLAKNRTGSDVAPDAITLGGFSI